MSIAVVSIAVVSIAVVSIAAVSIAVVSIAVVGGAHRVAEVLEHPRERSPRRQTESRRGGDLVALPHLRKLPPQRGHGQSRLAVLMHL